MNFDYPHDETFELAKQDALKIVDELRKEIEDAKPPTWIEGSDILGTHGQGSKLGVYLIEHLRRDERYIRKVMSVGMGKLGSRFSRLRSIWKNRGKAIHHENGSTTDHVALRKCYQIDADETNWKIHWCEIVNALLRECYETRVGKHYKPEFNLEGMFGK